MLKSYTNHIKGAPHRILFKAFTLAEVLITLGIIGAIAAITLPSLYGHIQEIIFTNKLIKTYNELSQATKLIVEDYGGINNLGSMGVYKTLLPQYMKISSGSTPSDYKTYLIGGNKTNNLSYYTWNYLQNGAVLRLPVITPDYGDNGYACYQTMALNESHYGTYRSTCGLIVIDLNGKQRPNIFGKDIFVFALVTDGVIPLGSSKETIWCQQFNSAETARTNSYYSQNYSAWVIYNKNMDYLHCSDLSWKGKHKCGN